jgi:predicted HTH domain antitoxin
MRKCRASQGVFEDPPVLHDDDEVLCRIFDQLDVGNRIAINKYEIGECSFLNHAELAGIRIALAG